MLVRDVVDRTAADVVMVAPDDTIADAVDLLKEHAIGAVVVSADGQLISGIISERDIVRHLAAEQEGTLRLKVEELMTENVSTCTADDDAWEAMATMTAGRFRHMPVVTATGGLTGIVSLGDLVKARLTELETLNTELRQQDGT